MEALLVSYEHRHAHDDPFDRLLHAQAKVAGWRLLRMDRTLPSCGAVILRP
jgi:PIN domain nuclease of toxin-antitoxin system